MAAKATDLRPLGLILVQRGVLTPDELDVALAEQEDVGGLLGEILIRRGYASRPQITEALAEQYGLQLTQEVGFGSGLRSKIERRHEARRNGGESESEDGAGHPDPPETA